MGIVQKISLLRHINTISLLVILVILALLVLYFLFLLSFPVFLLPWYCFHVPKTFFNDLLLVLRVTVTVSPPTKLKLLRRWR